MESELTNSLENPNFVYAVLRNKKRFEGMMFCETMKVC